MIIPEQFSPSVLLSETHAPRYGTEGVFAEAVAAVAKRRFFRNVELPGIAGASERRHIRDLIATHGFGSTMWIGVVLAAEQLSLSATDPADRERAVGRARELLVWASETGVDRAAILSGPDPGPANRTAALTALRHSIEEVAQYAGDLDPGLRIVLEPRDRGVHKKDVIGPTMEAVEFAEATREKVPAFGLVWDSAHVMLCGEDTQSSLRTAGPYVSQVHLSNPVPDRGHPLHGDRHLPFGPPGALSEADVPRMLREVAFALPPSQLPVPVALEVRTPEGGDPEQTVREAERILREGFAKYQ